jgi:hypothetical protein
MDRRKDMAAFVTTLEPISTPSGEGGGGRNSSPFLLSLHLIFQCCYKPAALHRKRMATCHWKTDAGAFSLASLPVEVLFFFSSVTGVREIEREREREKEEGNFWHIRVVTKKDRLLCFFFSINSEWNTLCPPRLSYCG